MWNGIKTTLVLLCELVREQNICFEVWFVFYTVLQKRKKKKEKEKRKKEILCIKLLLSSYQVIRLLHIIITVRILININSLQFVI